MTEQMILDRMAQMIRVGFVNARQPEKMRVKVTVRDTTGAQLVTDWLPVLCPRASGDMQYDLPDIGDQVLCLFLPYGLEQGFVIGAMYGKQVPPVQSGDKWHRKFADGTTLEYDRGAHKLSINVQGDFQLEVTGKINVKAGGPMTLEAPIIYERGTLVNTAKDGSPGNAVISGGLQVLSGGVNVPEGDVIAAGVSLVSHTTEGVMPGSGTSGTPTGGSASSPGTSPVPPDLLSDEENQLLEPTRLTHLGDNVEKKGTTTDRLINCLPEIAAAMAERLSVPEDRQGWLYLHGMFRRWLSGTGNDNPAACTEPFWVSWEWAMSYRRAAYAYALFIDPAYEEEQQSRNIYSQAALDKLGEILCREGYLNPEEKVVNFDFIESDWRRWEALYFTLRSVPRLTQADGLMAALAGFTLRALAAGKAENLGDGRWRVTVTRVAVFVHDIFNFAEDDSYFGNDLGLWSCVHLHGGVNSVQAEVEDDYHRLKNEHFRKFRTQFGYGYDFLVLSKPHTVENYKETSYVTVCTETKSPNTLR